MSLNHFSFTWPYSHSVLLSATCSHRSQCPPFPYRPIARTEILIRERFVQLYCYPLYLFNLLMEKHNSGRGGKQKHSYRATGRLLNANAECTEQSSTRRGMIPRRGCKEGNGQPCIKPAAAARHRHLACTVPITWRRGRHEMWQVLLEISSSLPWDLAEFYWFLLW